MSMSFFKFALDKLFKQFVRSNKRFPSPAEKKQLEDRAVVEAMAARKKEQAESGIETLEDLMTKKYPPHVQRDELGFMQKSYPDGVQPGSTMAKAIDEAEMIKKEQNMFKGFKPKVILGGDEAKRVKGGISTQIKLNSARENQQYAKDLIGGKSEEFKQLSDSDRKELLDLIETQIEKEGKDVFDGFAFGGLATMFRKR
jgi:hypothetical protein